MRRPINAIALRWIREELGEPRLEPTKEAPLSGPEWTEMEAITDAFRNKPIPLAKVIKTGNYGPNAIPILIRCVLGEFKKRGRRKATIIERMRSPIFRAAVHVPKVQALLERRAPTLGRGYKDWAIELTAEWYGVGLKSLRKMLGRAEKRPSALDIQQVDILFPS